MTRILIVDDEKDVVNYLVSELQAFGWQTGAAYDGIEAALKVIDGGWNAVLMDIRMPKMDGIGALRIIRRLAPQLPVILFTGQAGQGDMIEASRRGAFACLLKPVPGDKLIRVIQEALPRAVRGLSS
jgi:two-component system, NtrC family, response regulator AtoC